MAKAKKAAKPEMSHTTVPVEPPVMHAAEPVEEVEEAPPVVVEAPEAQPLRCRCGSTRFMAPQPVSFHQCGGDIVACPEEYTQADTMTFICLGCSDTGTMAQLQTRLLGIQPGE